MNKKNNTRFGLIGDISACLGLIAFSSTIVIGFTNWSIKEYRWLFSTVGWVSVFLEYLFYILHNRQLKKEKKQLES